MSVNVLSRLAFNLITSLFYAGVKRLSIYVYDKTIIAYIT